MKRDPILQEGFARLDLTVGHQPFSYTDSPHFYAAASLARVRSTSSSRSICAKLALTWKKKRPAGVFGVDTKDIIFNGLDDLLVFWNFTSVLKQVLLET